MIEPTENGINYWFTDEQLDAFARATPAERFRWLEETRRFFVAIATPEMIERHARLRRGETIVP